MGDAKKISESLPELLEKFNLRAAEMPPEDEVAEKRSEAEEIIAAQDAKHQRRMQEVCEGWGAPFRDAQQILRGQVDETEALRVVQKFYARSLFGGVLVLSGGNGCGKTLASTWYMLQEIARPYPYGGRWPRKLHPRFIPVGELMRVSLYGRDEEYQAYERCSVLVIDDVGTEFRDSKGSFMSRFDQLIATREKGPCWTVMTTNLPLHTKKGDSFTGRYGERILDRLHGDGCGYVHLKEDPSLRRKKPTT